MPTGSRIAPCRVFHATEERLVAGTGQPIPDDVPDDQLVYEDEALRLPPLHEPAQDAPPAGPSNDEPRPQTNKTGTKVRTRRRQPGENR